MFKRFSFILVLLSSCNNLVLDDKFDEQELENLAFFINSNILKKYDAILINEIDHLQEEDYIYKELLKINNFSNLKFENEFKWSKYFSIGDNISLEEFIKDSTICESKRIEGHSIEEGGWFYNDCKSERINVRTSVPIKREGTKLYLKVYLRHGKSDYDNYTNVLVLNKHEDNSYELEQNLFFEEFTPEYYRVGDSSKWIKL